MVASGSPFKTFADLARAAREKTQDAMLAGSGTNTANHAAQVRLDREQRIGTTHALLTARGEVWMISNDQSVGK